MSETDDLRTFVRDITRSSELVTKQLLDGFRRHTASVSSQMAALTAQTNVMTTELQALQVQAVENTKVLSDLHAESQAQRGAILAVLDELRRNRDR